uniref:Zinc transporter 2 n=1 Tax=Globodera pallida TaxID=36090 RepID=A0A183BKL3_GLOPA
MKKYVGTDQSRFTLLGSMENLADGEDNPVMAMEVGMRREVGHSLDGHCHALLLSRREEKSAEWMLWVVASISALHITVQLTGGVLANSLSIIADSGHILTDLLSFLISVFMIRISVVKSNRRYTFGYLRAEFIGAMASIFIIWTITILMVVFATQRIVAGNMTVDTRIMIITALIGIAFNSVMALFLKYSRDSIPFAHCHSHFGGSSEGYGEASGPKENVNVRAAFIHVLGDFIQNVGVLSAALLIRWTDFEMADPLCTYFFSLVVLCTSVPIARDIFLALMETAPSHLNYDAVRRDLNAISFVNGVHSLHFWSLNTEQRAAVAHLIIDDESKAVLSFIANGGYRSGYAFVNKQHTDNEMFPCSD